MPPRTTCLLDDKPIRDRCCDSPQCPWVVCSGPARHVIRRRDGHVAGTNHVGRAA